MMCVLCSGPNCKRHTSKSIGSTRRRGVTIYASDLWQVFTNLIANAIDAIGREGDLWLSDRAIFRE